MIDPSIWESETVMSLTPRQFKLYVYLISAADDEGRLRYSPKMLAARAFPLSPVSEAAVSEDVAAMQRVRLIQVYGNGEKYAAHPNWLSWQTINRPTESRYPAPPPMSEDENTLLEDSLSTHGALTEGSPRREEKRKEEKRREERAYGAHVRLTDEEYGALKAGLGESELRRFISSVNDYCDSKGKRYKDWAATIRAWARKDGKWRDRAPPGEAVSCPVCGSELDGGVCARCGLARRDWGDSGVVDLYREKWEGGNERDSVGA